MTPERWQQVKELLAPALEMDASNGSAFIDQLCGADESLRGDVNRLLAAADQVGPDFLNRAAQLETDSFADARTDVADSLLPSPKNSAVNGWVGRRVGPYRILELIGMGGMGEVYRAIRADDEYRKQVAIKVVRLGQNSLPFLHRFKAERQILATLDHPNIARLLDGGTALCQSGDFSGAIGEYREAAKLAEITHPESTTEEGLYASANALTGLGDIESRFAQQYSDMRTGREHRQKACDYYHASLKIWSKVHEPGVLSPDGFESVPPEVVSARADKCRKAAASP